MRVSRNPVSMLASWWSRVSGCWTKCWCQLALKAQSTTISPVLLPLPLTMARPDWAREPASSSSYLEIEQDAKWIVEAYEVDGKDCNLSRLRHRELR